MKGMVTFTCDTLILIRPRAYIESFVNVTDRVVKLSVWFSLDGSSLLYSNVTNWTTRVLSAYVPGGMGFSLFYVK